MLETVKNSEDISLDLDTAADYVDKMMELGLLLSFDKVSFYV